MSDKSKWGTESSKENVQCGYCKHTCRKDNLRNHIQKVHVSKPFKWKRIAPNHQPGISSIFKVVEAGEVTNDDSENLVGTKRHHSGERRPGKAVKLVNEAFEQSMTGSGDEYHDGSDIATHSSRETQRRIQTAGQDERSEPGSEPGVAGVQVQEGSDSGSGVGGEASDTNNGGAVQPDEQIERDTLEFHLLNDPDTEKDCNNNKENKNDTLVNGIISDLKDIGDSLISLKSGFESVLSGMSSMLITNSKPGRDPPPQEESALEKSSEVSSIYRCSNLEELVELVSSDIFFDQDKERIPM